MKNILLLAIILFLPLHLQADEAELSKQIVELKAILRSHQERIEKLEKLLLPQTNNKNRPVVVDKFAWQDIQNWNRIKQGMTRSQVESILGKATKDKVDVLHYLTLHYKGEKSGAGYVSGNVKLDPDDRVAYINKPVL